jgi:hypothetical protein
MQAPPPLLRRAEAPDVVIIYEVILETSDFWPSASLFIG